MSIEIDGKQYTWNVALCVRCWNDRNPDRPAVPEQNDARFVMGAVERCSYCGGGTTSGILARDDPRDVPFPRREEEDFETEVGIGLSNALILDLSSRP